MNDVFSERKFVLEASRERIWDLLGRVIIDSLELERFHARDDRNFNALTRVKIGFITVAMQIRGTMVDISEPEVLSVLLEVNGMGRIIQLNQKVKFTLSAIDKDKTEMICQIGGKRIGFPLGLFLMPRVKSFGSDILESIEKRLRQVA